MSKPDKHDCYDLGPKGEHLAAHKSFCRQFWSGQPVFAKHPNFWDFNGGSVGYPHSGYAWCATRQAIEWLGGLIETGALGAGDHHMALALVGQVLQSVPLSVTLAYLRPLLQWQARAQQHINQNIGFLWGTIEHFWHGRKVDRRYIDRWDVLTRHAFDPDSDLKRNSFGLLELAGNKPDLTRDIDRYFRQRLEDSNVV